MHSKGFWIAVVLISFFAYTSIKATSAQREGCIRGTTSREHQKFQFNYDVKTAKKLSIVAISPGLRNYYANNISPLEKERDSIPTVDCQQEYKYFGIFK